MYYIIMHFTKKNVNYDLQIILPLYGFNSSTFNKLQLYNKNVVKINRDFLYTYFNRNIGQNE